MSVEGSNDCPSATASWSARSSPADAAGSASRDCSRRATTAIPTRRCPRRSGARPGRHPRLLAHHRRVRRQPRRVRARAVRRPGLLRRTGRTRRRRRGLRLRRGATGWMGADNAAIVDGDVVAVWGAGSVGQMAAKAALLMGAGRVVVIDRFRERLDMVTRHIGRRGRRLHRRRRPRRPARDDRRARSGPLHRGRRDGGPRRWRRRSGSPECVPVRFAVRRPG